MVVALVGLKNTGDVISGDVSRESWREILMAVDESGEVKVKDGLSKAESPLL